MNTKEYFEAKTRLNKFLDEHPDLKPMQKKIDEMLKGAGNFHNRRILLTNMMRENMKAISISFQLINLELKKLEDLTK